MPCHIRRKKDRPAECPFCAAQVPCVYLNRKRSLKPVIVSRCKSDLLQRPGGYGFCPRTCPVKNLSLYFSGFSGRLHPCRKLRILFRKSLSDHGIRRGSRAACSCGNHARRILPCFPSIGCLLSASRAVMRKNQKKHGPYKGCCQQQKLLPASPVFPVAAAAAIRSAGRILFPVSTPARFPAHIPVGTTAHISVSTPACIPVSSPVCIPVHVLLFLYISF